ncbi:MAG: phosphate acetyltransferase, partial [Micrococcales bacterium]
MDTYETGSALHSVKGKLTPDATRKVSRAIDLFEKHVDIQAEIDRLNLERPSVVTPLMFEHKLVSVAQRSATTIVLPEGTEPRILKAADEVLRRNIAELILLGDAQQICERAAEVGANIANARLLDPINSELTEQFMAEYQERRKHKQIPAEVAFDRMRDVSYFGTMLVLAGQADGMVSGAAHTTAHTIRPAIELLRDSEKVDTVSSSLFMCLPDKVLVYADCAIVPDPTDTQLADIAISSADTATAFGLAARVAMLSYSTGSSGSGTDVEKVRAATHMVRERRPDIVVEGPLQYDAAVDPGVAATKMPDSPVAGKATVLIFPDLNTGNNTYKAVQRSAGAVAVGPLLQGLKRPVNDLSRG